ncbi:MAG: divalent metal cation transporter FieF [Magnetovibrio sp.]|nr:divalent metal cation transporter FieF [Magnetovibrio sp.]
MRLASYASVVVAVVLITVKFIAWIMTDSVSLLSTLLDSVLDAGASIINLIAVRQALQPADEEHRFGHGKAEPIAGLAQAAFIAGSAMFLLIQAGERVIFPKEIVNAPVGYIVMLFSIGVTVCLVVFQSFVIRRSGSLVIKVDSLHYRGDILINASVLLSIFLASEVGFLYADPIFAVAIAGYILFCAWHIGSHALDMLMDHELPDEERAKIESIVLEQDGVKGLHDLRTRASGTSVFIQMHLEMDGDLALREAHEIGDRVERVVEKAFPSAEVIVHQDPDDLDEQHDLPR